MGSSSFVSIGRTALVIAIALSAIFASAGAYAYNRNDALAAIGGLTETWSKPQLEPWIDEFRGAVDIGVNLNDEVTFQAESSALGFFAFLFVDAKGAVSLFKPSADEPVTSARIEGLRQAGPLGEQFLFAIQTATEIPNGSVGFDARQSSRVVGADLKSVTKFVADIQMLANEIPLALSARYSYFIDGETQYTTRGIKIAVNEQIQQIRRSEGTQDSEKDVLPTGSTNTEADLNSQNSPQPGIALARSSSGMQLDIKFKFDRAELTFEGRQELDVLGNTMVDLQGRGELPVVLLEGHTDSLGSSQYNRELSTRRAVVAKHYLTTEFGLAGTSIVATGMGEDFPVANNLNRAGRAKNRRVVLKVQQ